MSVTTFVKYDLRAPGFGVPTEQIYRECLEQCAWADEHGFHGVRFHEHHRSDDGYLPQPIIMGSAVAGRTTRLTIRLSVVVLPLHDPIELAEQLSVLDLVSGGRLEVVFGAGYVPEEFAMFGRDIKQRGTLVERNVEVLRRAWRGEEFDFDGRPVKIRPLPHGGRSIPIYLGGSGPVAARRAARIADGFEPSPRSLLTEYFAECRRLGKEPGWHTGPGHDLRLLHVAEDPDRAWARMKRFAQHETDSYASWIGAAGAKVGFVSRSDPDDLRAPTGPYAVVTPDETVDLIRGLGPDAEIQLHPLMGGMDPDLGWECLELYRSRVVPALAAEGLVQS